MKKVEIKVGDRVEVIALSKESTWHGYKKDDFLYTLHTTGVVDQIDKSSIAEGFSSCTLSNTIKANGKKLMGALFISACRLRKVDTYA